MKHTAQTFSSLITLIFLFTGCAQQAPTPGPTPIGQGDQNINNEGQTVGANDGNSDDTGQTSGSQLNPTDHATCIRECEANCEVDRNECYTLADSEADLTRSGCDEDFNECTTACDTRPWDQGGCNDVTVDAGGDEERIIPPGTVWKNISLKHCTQNQDALTINNGVLGFVTQRGALNVERGKYRSGQSPDYHFWNQNHFKFAAAGMAGQYMSGTKGKATITIGGTQHAWPLPGAIAFDLKSKIADLDPARPTFFVRDTVIRHGNSEEKAQKSAHWHLHNDYWGTDYHQDVMMYRNGFKWKEKRSWKRDKWHFVNCDFTTNFKLFYYPKN